jgi:hypothetical protein
LPKQITVPFVEINETEKSEERNFKFHTAACKLLGLEG